MMNRSHQFQQHLGQGHFSDNFERRTSSSSQNSNVDREVLDLIQRIRNCKPYLLKRIKAIEEAGQTKLLRDEVKDIHYWLEIAKEVRADIIYGRDTLEVVLEKMMDMIRLHPIQEAFSSQIHESDEEDEAPRSPSPPSGNDFDSGPRVIPMERNVERNQEQSNDWGVPRRDYLPQNSQSSTRKNEDWGGNQYSRRGDNNNSSRGDTDMRLDPGFSNDGRPMQMGRGRGLATPFRDDCRNVVINNSDSLRRNPNWSGGGDSYNNRNDSDGPREIIERGRERSRGAAYDYDYRRRSRSRSRDRYSRGRSRSRDRNGRERSRSNERNSREPYFRDEDLRDITRHGDQRNPETIGVRGYDFDRPSRDIRDPILNNRDRSSENRRHEFNDQDNRDNPWSNAMQQQQHGINPTFSNEMTAAIHSLQKTFSPGPFMFPPAFMSMSNLQQQQQQQQSELLTPQNLGLLASQLPNLGGLLPTPVNQMAMGLPNQSSIQNMHMGPQNPHHHQQQLGNNSPLHATLGPQSPLNINNSYASHINSAPPPPVRQSGLLPTPSTIRPNVNNQNNFTPPSHIPYSATPSLGNANQGPQRPPPTIPNRCDVRPRHSTPDLNQFRQRAQQHFARPRPHNPTVSVMGPGPSPAVPPKPSTVPIGSNSTINPNLATNQIVSDLPLDPRRRSQLERQSLLQQQQSHTSDSRQRRPLSSPPPPDSSPNRSQTTSSNSNNNRRRDASQRGTSPTLKRIADRVKDIIPSKEKPKTNKLQELRKTLEKQGYHRLGAKGKNTFEEVASEHPRAKSPDKEKEQTRMEKDKVGDDRSKRQSSPPSTAKGSSKNSKETRSKDKSPKKNDRKSNKSLDDDDAKNTGKKSRKSPVKSKEKNSPNSTKNVAQKSVTAFRIPKIKKPDPPPEILAPTEPTINSPDRKIDEIDEVESSDMELMESEVGSKSDKCNPSTATPSVLSSETDVLLRMFMSKSVGLDDSVLEQIVNNPSAMEKIKSLLKDQVTKIVESPSSPPVPSIPLDKIKTEVGAEDSEDSSRLAVSPNQALEEEVPSRSRGLPKRKASKRRSSLERLHDALREMNFDAILPLGPRRATAHTRGQSDGQSEQQSVRQQQAIKIPPSGSSTEPTEHGTDESDSNAKEMMVDDESLTPSDGTPEKGEPKVGKKRKGKGAVTVGKKRGRKVGTAVTAAAAKLAVSAIPEFEIGDKNTFLPSDSESNSEPVSKITTPKKGAKKGKRGESNEKIDADVVTTDVDPLQTPRETRSTSKKEASKKVPRSLDPPAEARVLRPRSQKLQQQPDIRINPHLNKVKIEQDYNPGVAVKMEAVEREESFQNIELDTSMVEKEKEKESTSPPPSLLFNVSPVTPSSFLPPVSPPLTSEQDTQPNVPDESMEKEQTKNDEIFDRSVFLGLSPDPNSDTSNHVPSHDKLLTDAGAPLIVKKVFPTTLFGKYLEALSQNKPDQEQLNVDDCKSGKISTSTEISQVSQECKDVVEWMLNTIQFRHDQDCYSLCTENDDIVDSCHDLILDSSIVNSTKSSDDEDEDEEDEEDNDDSASDSVSPELNHNIETNLLDKLQIKVETESDVENISRDPEDMVTTMVQDVKEEPFELDTPTKDEKEEVNEDSSNEEEGEGGGGRTTNLEGHELYRCANQGCNFTAPNGAAFKEHAFICSFVPASKQAQCFHCEKKLKSASSLMEHLKIHGKPRQVCSLCSFRCWVSSELTKHMKNVHRVYNCKVVRETMEGEDPIQIMYPKEVASKITQAHDLTQNHILYASKVQFQPHELDSVPRTSIFTTLVHCALCEYSTKVRSNIIRHLRLHTISEKDGGDTKVPNKAPVNPVPCLERKELMFDKMMNWAGYTTLRVGAVSKEDTLKLPKYVVDQFRYVCSVESCKQITGQDDILCSHMKALHFKEKVYICPHCQEDEPTKDDPRNVVPIEKIPHHLKLHGPRLSKCGHCDYIHHSSTSMEKHVAVKHVEKKPIFYLIRDLDGDGNPMNRRTSVDEAVKTSERWRCNLCKAVLNSWDDAMHHVQTAHKIKNQFECSLCHFGSDSIYAISTHSSACRQGSQSKANIMIMFLRNETFEIAEPKSEDGVNMPMPIWRRDAPRVKHIRGIFLEDETKPSGFSSTASSGPPKLSQSKTSSMPSANSASPKTSCQVILVCPKCKLYKTKNAVDMKVHLFNELNYQRYKCTICELQFVTIDSLKVHISNDHKSSIDLEEAKSELPVNSKIENKVYEIISSQLKNADGQKAVDDKDGRNIENLLCKHCFLQFSSYHNYRTHILAKHMEPRFKCKYCNLGFWHEVMLKQHHQKSSHADKPYIVILNKELEAMLSPDFWFQEYGIPLSKSITRQKNIDKKRGRPAEGQATKYLKCGYCDFTTESPVGLRSHELLCPSALKIYESQPHPSGGGKRSPVKRRSISTSDGGEDLYFSQSPIKKGATNAKKFNNMSSLFRCEHCSCTFFTKRGVRRHWGRVHSLNELSCRYYEVKSQNDDNLAVHDGVVLLCRYCSYETSNATHMQNHHEKEHPSHPCRFKRKKRTIDADVGQIDIIVCSDCHCEFENVKKYKVHCQEKHPKSTLKHKTMKVNSQEKMEPELADAKLLEDNVVVECPSCSQDCGSAKQYENHFKNYHNGLEYLPPVFKYSRSVIVDEVEIDLRVPNNKLPTTSRRDSGSEDLPVLKRHGTSSNEIQPTVLYACPKCDFKCSSMESLTNSHLVNHLLAYLCPICNVGFHKSADALFHVRHFHGECRLKPSQNPTAYVQFSSLKDQITKVSNPKSNEVIVINLSDDELDEEFDDSALLSLHDSSPLRRLQNEDLDFDF